MTIGDMIKHHQELKAFVEREDKAYDERIKPYRDGMYTIENYISAELQRQGLQNFKSDAGTAYLSTTLSITVDNREEFLDFVRQEHWEFLDARCLKDPVREWQHENAGQSPPGVRTEFKTKCNIRKS